MRKIVIETPVKLPGTNIMLEEGDSLVIHKSNVMQEGGGAGVAFGFPEFNLESKIFIPIKNGNQLGFKPVGFSGEAILSSYQDTRSTTDLCSRREKLGNVLSVDILYYIEDYMKSNRVDYSMAQIQGVRIDEIHPKEYVHGGGYRRADFPETMSMEASVECTVIDYDGTHLDNFFDIETEISIEFGYADCVKHTYMDLDSGESYDESKTVTKESVSVLLDKGDQKVFQAFLKKLGLNSFDDYSEIDHGNQLSYIFTDDDWYQLIQPNRDEFLRNSKHGFKKVVESVKNLKEFVDPKSTANLRRLKGRTLKNESGGRIEFHEDYLRVLHNFSLIDEFSYLSSVLEGTNRKPIEEAKEDVKDVIKSLQGDFGGENKSQMKGLQLLKFLATSDKALANKFMKALDKATTKISKEVLGGNGK